MTVNRRRMCSLFSNPHATHICHRRSGRPLRWRKGWDADSRMWNCRRSRISRHRALGFAGGVACLAAVSLTGGAASAQANLDAQYRVSLLGLPIGTGSWSVDLAGDHYTMKATGQVAGIMKAFSSGEGTASVRGTIAGAKLLPAGYTFNVKTGGRTDDVRMALASSAVKQLSVEPPTEPKPDRIPLTEAHKRGIIDPISAGVLPAEKGPTADVCQRTVAIFDGRMRFDLALSFKRMARVKSEKGYEGPVVVCGIRFNPIGGHEPGKSGIRFLRETKDMEIWYAPIAGTHFVAMYRIMMPTQIGIASIEATRFVAAPVTVRAGAASPKTQ
jgi:hypothetical protein